MVLKYIKFTIWPVVGLDIGFYPKQRRYIMGKRKRKKQQKKQQKKKKNRYRERSAITGRYVPEGTEAINPDITVKEEIKS